MAHIIDDLTIEPVGFPQTPLHRQRLFFRINRIKRTLMLLRQIQIDRHGFRQHEPTVIDGRYAAVGIQGTKFRRQCFRRARQPVFVFKTKAKLAHHPDHAYRA